MDQKARTTWNQQQKQLRGVLSSSKESAAWRELFYQQFAILHPSDLTPEIPVHFEDEILSTLSQDQWRWIPPKGEHSVAWNIWHLTRIEDMTMSWLLAGRPQIFFQQPWQNQLGIEQQDSGNRMPVEEIHQFSQRVVISALQAYRLAVSRQTMAVIQSISWQDLKKKVDSGRLHQLLLDGSVRPEAVGLIEYWGSLKNYGLLLMPPTRHTFVHLNEARQIAEKALKSRQTH